MRYDDFDDKDDDKTHANTWWILRLCNSWFSCPTLNNPIWFSKE